MARVTKSGNSNSNGSAFGFEATLSATDGELQFTLPDALKAPPISQHGNVAESIGKFGGADQLRNARLYLSRKRPA